MSKHTNSNLEPSAHCPRCGYDLSGHVAAWNDTCPLHGQCSECGLTLRWANLLNPNKRDLPWLYEHASHWSNFRKATNTAFRALFPWSLWRRIELHHRVVPSRLLIWVIGLALCSYFVLTLAVAIAYIAESQILKLPAPMLTLTSTDIGSPVPTVAVGSDKKTAIFELQDQRVTIPLPTHAYFLPEVHLTELGRVYVAVDDTEGVRLARTTSSNEPSIHFPSYILVVRRPYLPWSSPLTDRLPAVWKAALLSGPASWGLGMSALRNTNRAMISLNPAWYASVAFIFLAACVVLAAPSEWKRAHVRNAHLLRIICLSTSPLLILFGIQLATWAWAEIGTVIWNCQTFPIPFGALVPQGPTNWLVPPLALAQIPTTRTHPLLAVTLAAWLPIFWWFAFKRGMKLKRPFMLWLFVTIGGLLGYVIVLNAMDTYFTHLFI